MTKRENVATQTLEECFALLKDISDPLLQEVAIAIFAPKGTRVPGPSHHSQALHNMSRITQYEIMYRGKLENLFAEDEQASTLLLLAINKIHALFKAPQLDSESLKEALEIIREG